MVAEVAGLLREPSPFGLLAMASGLIEATTQRPLDAWPGARVERPDGPSLFLSFARSDWPAMGALALAVAALHPDADVAGRLRAAVDVSGRASPRWLGGMDAIEVTGTWLQTHVLGDGENVVVSWRWPDGSAATAFVYVDHNMGTLVKDAFVVPEAGEPLLASIADSEPPHSSTLRIDPADARARIVGAIEAGERCVPPLASDSWPSCRPMVEWVLRRLPTGGVGYERPDWPDADRERLLDEFIASPQGRVAGLAPGQVRDLADPLVWFACDYGPGDPLRWSPVSVEIVLTDWYPRKVIGFSAGEAARLGDVLEGFVRFSHTRRAVPPELTDETVEAIGRWGPVFREAVAGPGPSREGNARRLALLAGGFDPDADDLDEERWPEELDDDEFLAWTVTELEAELVAVAGGPDALEALTDEPLGDIAFDWSKIPEPARPLTADTLAHLDRWSDELFDAEVRTIARGVLAGVVAADPSVFKRSPRTDALAAAVLAYLMNRLTGRMSAAERRLLPWSVFTQKDLAAATGVSASTISSRSRTVANVVARAEIDWPNLLHSTQRHEVLLARRQIAEWRDR